MVRRPHRDRVEACGREIGDGAGGRARQDEGERARPEGGGEPLGRRVEPAEPARRLDVRDMGDQRVERRPALRRVKPRDRRAVRRVRA
jgi:hypothetical protein